tara:strand:- start:181 stop:543 length:363 start_codon:yes stop_codon:yes gene_type:complete
MKDLFVDKIVFALVVRNKTSKTLTYVWVTGKNKDNTYTIREPNLTVKALDYLKKNKKDFGKEYTIREESKLFKVLTKKKAKEIDTSVAKMLQSIQKKTITTDKKKGKKKSKIKSKKKTKK